MPDRRAHPALIALYHAARHTIDRVPQARNLARLPRALPSEQPRVGLSRPRARLISKLARQSTDPLLHALAAAAPHLDWRNSYGPEAFGALFLHRSAWAEIVGPQGAFFLEDLRVTFGIWDTGLDYDWHAHGPEEVYVALSGRARILSAGQRPRDTRRGPVHHRAWQAHRLERGAAPFVTMAVWSGGPLSEVSRMGRAA